MGKKFYIAAILILVLLVGGCVAKKTATPDPKTADLAEKQAAKNNEEAAKETEKSGEPSTLLISADDSVVNWYSKKVLVSTKHNGTVQVKEGFITLSGELLTGGEISIDMTTIKDKDMEGQSGASTLEKHLMSEDFFDVAKYPTANFVIKSVTKKSEDDGGSIYALVGDMRIKDKTNSIELEAKLTNEDGKLRIGADFSIDRTLWEIKYGSDKFFKSLGDNLIDDIIEYKLDLVVQK